MFFAENINISTFRTANFYATLKVTIYPPKYLILYCKKKSKYDIVSILYKKRKGKKWKKNDKYFENINDTKQNYEDEEDYKNVKLSDVKTIEVDGREFSYKTLKYEYEGISTTYKYRNIYVCSKISDKNIVIIEVKDSGEMEDSEIKEFLKMKITDM